MWQDTRSGHDDDGDQRVVVGLLYAVWIINFLTLLAVPWNNVPEPTPAPRAAACACSK